MSSENVYEELYKAVKQAGGAIPVFPNEELFSLLKELVTPEQAALAIRFPGESVTAEALAEKTDGSKEDVTDKLETMTDNGFLHTRKNREGVYEYRILPLLPGIFEAQFFRGTKEERDYRIAHRFKDYLDLLNKMRESLPEPLPPPRTSYFRVIPVEEEIKSCTNVLPYAQLSKYIEKTEVIAVGTCFCRHHAVLIDENDDCGVSHKNCMAFGEGAIFVSERHNGRLISKEEALEILKQAEDDGLVHCTANISDELVFICNCCSCHCGILGMVKSISPASEMLTSGYHAKVDTDLCSACETCLDRCPVSAISIDKTASVDDLQCIGCGLCVGTCPVEAINLVLRPDNITPPGNLVDLEKVKKTSKM